MQRARAQCAMRRDRRPRRPRRPPPSPARCRGGCCGRRQRSGPSAVTAPSAHGHSASSGTRPQPRRVSSNISPTWRSRLRAASVSSVRGRSAGTCTRVETTPSSRPRQRPRPTATPISLKGSSPGPPKAPSPANLPPRPPKTVVRLRVCTPTWARQPGGLTLTTNPNP